MTMESPDRMAEGSQNSVAQTTKKGDIANDSNVSEEPVQRSRPVQPDGGWGWVVCLTTTLCIGNIFGILNGSSVIFVIIMEEFKEEEGSFETFKIAFVPTLILCMVCLLSSLAGVLSDRFGFQKVAFVGGFLAFVGMLSSAFVRSINLLYLTFGILLGTGLAFTFPITMLVLVHYFDKRLGLANGIMTCCGSLLAIGYIYAIPVIHQQFGLETLLLCLSGVNFFLMVYAVTWKPVFPPSMEPKDKKGVEGRDGNRLCCRWLNLRIWRNRRYVVCLVASTVAFFGYFVYGFHMVAYADARFPGQDSRLLPVWWTGGTVLASFALIFLLDRPSLRTRYVWLLQALFFLLGATTITVPLYDHFAWLVVVAVVQGACDGSFFALAGPLLAGIVGVQDSSQAVGFLFGSIAIPLTAGPTLAGLLLDYTDSYALVFHVFGIPPLLGTALLFLYPYVDAQDQKSSPGLCCCESLSLSGRRLSSYDVRQVQQSPRSPQLSFNLDKEIIIVVPSEVKTR